MCRNFLDDIFCIQFSLQKFLSLIVTLILWYLYSVVILIPSHLILHIFTNFIVHEPILILELRVFCLFNFLYTEKLCNYKKYVEKCCEFGKYRNKLSHMKSLDLGWNYDVN